METNSHTTKTQNQARDEGGEDTAPDRQKTPMGVATAIFLSGVSAFWLLNFNMGMVEIPDVLPVIGHLDEAAALVILLRCMTYLGIDVMPMIRKVLNLRESAGFPNDDEPGGVKKARGRDVTGQ